MYNICKNTIMTSSMVYQRWSGPFGSSEVGKIKRIPERIPRVSTGIGVLSTARQELFWILNGKIPILPVKIPRGLPQRNLLWQLQNSPHKRQNWGSAKNEHNGLFFRWETNKNICACARSVRVTLRQKKTLIVQRSKICSTYNADLAQPRLSKSEIPVNNPLKSEEVPTQIVQKLTDLQFAKSHSNLSK